MKILLLMAISILLTGCYATNYEDVSSFPEYIDLIGEKYRTLDELIMHGVQNEGAPREIIHHYTVMQRPGFGGGEVLTKKFLDAGTVIQIKKALSCPSCLDLSERFIIEIISPRNDVSEPIILMDGGEKRISIKKNNGQVVMNVELFETLKH